MEWIKVIALVVIGLVVLYRFGVIGGDAKNNDDDDGFSSPGINGWTFVPGSLPHMMDDHDND